MNKKKIIKENEKLKKELLIYRASCTIQKKNTATFEQWLSKFNLRKVGDLFISKNGKTLSLNLMIEVYKNQKKKGFV